MIFIYLFVFWLQWVSVAVLGLTLVVAGGGSSALQCQLLTEAASPVGEHRLQAGGLQELCVGSRVWFPGSGAQAE